MSENDCPWCEEDDDPSCDNSTNDACDVRSCNEDATRDDGLCDTHGWLEDNRTVGR